MQHSVQYCRGNRDVRENLAPLGEHLVRREHGGDLLISPGDQLEKQVRPLDVHRQIPDLVDDKHPVLAEHLEPVRQTVLKVRLFQLFYELVAVDVVGREPVSGGDEPQSRCQMGLADARRPFLQ